MTELPPQNIGLWPRAHPGRRHFPINLQLFVVESAVHGITITSRKREHEKSEMRTAESGARWVQTFKNDIPCSSVRRVFSGGVGSLT